MRVKIRNKWFDSKDTPLCIELSDTDKKNIKNMIPSATKYAVFDDSSTMSVEEMLEWME